jgi:hypothetical protein
MNRRIQQLKKALHTMKKDALIHIILRICESDIHVRQELEAHILSAENPPCGKKRKITREILWKSSNTTI